MAHYLRLALVPCLSSIPGHGIRVLRKNDIAMQEVQDEAPLQAIGDGKHGEPFRVVSAVPGTLPPSEGNATSVAAAEAGLQSVTWRVNELVGYVGEGNVVARGQHGPITSFHDSGTTANVRYGNGTVWNHLLGELYKVHANGYGFKGGQRVEFIGGSNNGNIRNRQLGIVQSFSETSRRINWWDLRQNKGFAVTPEMVRVPDPYSPKRGSGAWMPKYSVYKGSQIKETFGTSKTSSSTQTSSWANAVTSTLSVSMKAGVSFLGASLETEIGTTISGTTSRSHTSSVSDSWTANSESEYTLPFSADGFLWQWQVRTELDNRNVISSFTKSFAVTTGQFQKPRCLPGFQTDGLPHQVCFSRDTTLF